MYITKSVITEESVVEANYEIKYDYKCREVPGKKLWVKILGLYVSFIVSLYFSLESVL